VSTAWRMRHRWRRRAPGRGHVPSTPAGTAKVRARAPST
jgi:hypothetical protein